MSLDELRDDLRRNAAEARTLTTIEQVIGHLVNTLWPTIEAVLDVVDEQDGSIRELVDHEEDYLQPETGALFAAVVQSSLQLAAELRKRIGGDPLLAKLIVNHEQICAEAIQVIGAITMMPADDEDEDEEGASNETQADTTSDGGIRE